MLNTESPSASHTAFDLYPTHQLVDALIEQLVAVIHREKSWVKLGISPFGLGRVERRAPGIAGFSQYDKLYADVELWLRMGWLDYLSPQLYWPIDQMPQAFAASNAPMTLVADATLGPPDASAGANRQKVFL